MPIDLFEPFKESLARGAMWNPGESVLVAVSGGPDSVCLLDLFQRLRQETPFPLAVAHLNHHLRGRESDRDEKFVEKMAQAGHLAFHGTALPEGSLSGTGEGLEGAAREARYKFLSATARKTGARRVALGHHREDQAETFLLRLLRGAGRLGLGGIYPVVDGLFIRPLLETPRAEILEYLEARKLKYRTDSSNRDLKRTRNRIRRRLLPTIRKEFNPEIDEILARTAEVFREEEAYLDEVARNLEERFLTREEIGFRLPIPTMRALPVALRRRLLRRALQRASEEASLPPPPFDWVVALEGLAEEGRHGAAVTLGKDREARVLYADLILGSPPRRVAQEPEAVPLPVPGEAGLPSLGVLVRALETRMAEAPPLRAEPNASQAVLDAETLPGPLFIRSRRAGDAFRPLGSPGESKLKSYLIDQKVPRPIRDRIPLVVSGGKIAWVVGFQINDCFKITPETRRVLVLSKETL